MDNMEVSSLNAPIHIVGANCDVLSVINDIVDFGLQEDNFYVCNIGDIVRQHRMWETLIPRAQPFYAVKCNDSPTVIAVLAALGAGFDCASKNEIHKVLSMGISPDRIIFANPTKPSSYIKYASTKEVFKMTFDNEQELQKVKNLCPKAKLVIRIRCDDDKAQISLGNKFGCDPVTEAPRLLQVARSLNMDIMGVSFHVGFGSGDPTIFRRAIAAARNVFDMAASLGYNFDFLDIGGGYPGNDDHLFQRISEVVNAALEDYFPDPSVKIISEPGTFYVYSSYTLAAQIHSIRNVPINDPPGIYKMYYITDGLHGTFDHLLTYESIFSAQPQPLYQRENIKNYPCTIWGPTLDRMDKIAEKINLPEMKINEWLIFRNMGAYTLVTANTFNGFPIPEVYYIADEKVWLLLKDLWPLSEKHFVLNDTIRKYSRNYKPTS